MYVHIQLYMTLRCGGKMFANCDASFLTIFLSLRMQFYEMIICIFYTPKRNKAPTEIRVKFQIFVTFENNANALFAKMRNSSISRLTAALCDVTQVGLILMAFGRKFILGHLGGAGRAVGSISSNCVSVSLCALRMTLGCFLLRMRFLAV